jgi:hypothetical protein
MLVIKKKKKKKKEEKKKKKKMAEKNKTRFWNNLYQVRSKPNNPHTKMGARKPKNLNRITKIC